jgi:hypothetical protein
MKLFSILAVSSVFGEYEDGVYVGDGWVSAGQVVDESGEQEREIVRCPELAGTLI